VKDAAITVGLGEVPNTPAFRMQEQETLGRMITALAGDPQALAVLTPLYIEGSTLPNRTEAADDLRRMKGIPTAGDRQAKQANEVAMQQQQQEQQNLAKQAAAAALDKTHSETARNNAAADKLDAETATLALTAHGAMPPPPQAPQPGPSEDDVIKGALQDAQTVA
jgi:hypothetical protein